MAEDMGDSRPLADLLVYSNNFGQPPFPHSYTPPLDYTFDYCFTGSGSSIEIPLGHVGTLTNSTMPAPTSPTEEWSNPKLEPVDGSDHPKPDFSNVTTLHEVPCSTNSSWTALYILDDVPAHAASQVQACISPFPSFPNSLNCDFPCLTPITTDETPPKCPTTRKRGRPRRPHKDSSPSTFPDCLDEARTQRLIHTQVERKYRHGLNAGIERLRCAVPPLLHGKDDATPIQARPSKLTVLAGAIEYIKNLEQERDAAVKNLNYLNDALLFVKGRTSVSNQK